MTNGEEMCAIALLICVYFNLRVSLAILNYLFPNNKSGFSFAAFVENSPIWVTFIGTTVRYRRTTYAYRKKLSSKENFFVRGNV